MFDEVFDEVGRPKGESVILVRIIPLLLGQEDGGVGEGEVAGIGISAFLGDGVSLGKVVYE